jgi:hypothetical protein
MAIFHVAYVLCWTPFFLFNMLDVYKAIPTTDLKKEISAIIQVWKSNQLHTYMRHDPDPSIRISCDVSNTYSHGHKIMHAASFCVSGNILGVIGPDW